MKKALIVLFVLAVVGAFAFADSPPTANWTAWNQGDLFLYTQVGSGSPTYGWGPTWDNAGNLVSGNNFPGIDQEWSFNYAGENYGFNATLEFGGLGPNGFFGPGSSSWFGTYYKFGKMAKVTFGAPRIDLGTGTLVEGAATDRLVNGNYSATLELTPMSGLTLDLVAYVPTSTTLANVFNGAPAGGWQGIASAVPLAYGNNLGAAVKYAMPNFGSFMLQYVRQGSSTATTMAQMVGVVDYTGMKNIEVKAQYVANNLGYTAAAGATAPALQSQIFLSASYDMAPINLALDTGFSQAAATGGTAAYGAEANITYAIDKTYSAGVKVGYDNGQGLSLFDNATGAWDGFEVWPSIQAGFANGSSVNAGVVYASGANGHSSVIAVPIYYVWSF